MGDATKIEWCHATINAISGCTVLSPGCTNCYAMRAGNTPRPHHPSKGLTKRASNGHHVWTGSVRLNEEWLKKPLKWAKPRRIFWNAHGDPFHASVPQEWVDRELAIAALTPHHRHLILTKRSDRMRRYFENTHLPERVLGWCRHFGFLPDGHKWQWPLPNVWLGVSVEDQKRANERISDLLATPAALRWLSCEPLLQPVQIEEWLHDSTCNEWPGTCICGCSDSEPPEAVIKWVVAGGESGPGARSVHPDAFTSLRDQCATAGTPFLFKQWGEWIAHDQLSDEQKTELKGKKFDPHTQCVRLGRKPAGRLLDGKLHHAFPELFPWERANQPQTNRAATRAPEMAHG